MKKLSHLTFLAITCGSIAALTPALVACNKNSNPASRIEAFSKKAPFVGDEITKDDFEVSAVYSDGSKKVVTDWECETQLPYKFTDTEAHIFVIKYSNLKFELTIRASEPATTITITYTAGEHGSIEGQTSTTIQAPVKWCFLSLPVTKADTGYVFDKWVDKDGNEITNDRTINEDFTAKATFKVVTAGEEGMTFTLQELSSDSYYIVKWDGSDNIKEDLVIPSTHKSSTDPEPLPVKRVTGFKNCSKIKTVTIPSSVTQIDQEAFAYDLTTGSSQITTVSFADNSNLTSIGGKAFYGCGQLASIKIPKSVKTIGDSAFDMSSITTPSFGTLLFETDSVLTNIGKDAFKNCVNLSSVTLPTNIKTLGGFNGTSLTSITIPASVTELLDGCFYTGSGTTGTLATITIPADSALITIGESAFRNSKISSIVIPDTVTTIGGHAFEDCTNLATVTFTDNSQLTTLGNGQNVFAKCPITTFVIPSTVETIGASLFGTQTEAQITSLTFKATGSKWKLGFSAEAEIYQVTDNPTTDASNFKAKNDGCVWNKQA